MQVIAGSFIVRTIVGNHADTLAMSYYYGQLCKFEYSKKMFHRTFVETHDVPRVPFPPIKRGVGRLGHTFGGATASPQHLLSVQHTCIAAILKLDFPRSTRDSHKRNSHRPQ